MSQWLRFALVGILKRLVIGGYSSRISLKPSRSFVTTRGESWAKHLSQVFRILPQDQYAAFKGLETGIMKSFLFALMLCVVCVFGQN